MSQPAIDLERRKTVMTRSIKLGHCVCDPRQGCPCETFKDHNVCPCAGERLPAAEGPVRLTQHVRKAGCASKIGQADLKRILGHLPAITDPRVLVGASAGDDAGVFRINDQVTLVQTVDVFTPVVDDAYLFGQIAAANSLSDIYAMGAQPLTALSIIAFPIETLDGSVMEALLQGGISKLQEAGCVLLGGHSLQDEEIKCGFAVTGLLDGAQAIVRDNAQPGDRLVLTKPLGTGIISFAAQIGRIEAERLNEAGQMMARLNRDAAEVMRRYPVHACTDVTGFGLLGHLTVMARHSRAGIRLELSQVPVLTTAFECVQAGIISGAVERNQEYTMGWVRLSASTQPIDLPALYDPQTSGGLLISLPPAAADAYVREMHDRGHTDTSIVGEVVGPDRNEGYVYLDGRLGHLVGASSQQLHENKEEPIVFPAPSMNHNERTTETACCAHVDPEGQESRTEAAPTPKIGAPQPSGSGPNPPTLVASELTAARFKEFMEQASGEGQIGAKHKKLMAIALSVALRCQPCLRLHLKSALAMGIAQTEIDEAAWLAVGFAGSPSLMAYREAMRELREKMR
jgi:selenide, water dikinase